jgi:tetratricopeptide (TPR) repeat protein
LAPSTLRPNAVEDPELASLSDQVKANPQDADVFYKRGLLYAKRNDFALAIKDFDEVVRLKPRDAMALNNRCWARAMISDLQNALKDCTEAIQIRPGFADALDSRGLVNLKAGMNVNAVTDYNAALKLSRQASSLYGRGIAKRRTGDAAGANRDIAEAKLLDPNIERAFDGYGVR